jgi:membrane-associated phospholipid phosphatase
MFLMQMRAIVLAFSCAASSLTLTAPVCRPAPPQTEEQRAGEAKQSSSGTEVKEKTTPKKTTIDPEVEPFESSQRSFVGLGKRFLMDQEQIWTSPAKIRFSDTQWLVPLSGITAGLFVTDSDYSRHLSQNPSTISHYKTLSNVGLGALIGGAGGMWLLGHVKHNEHWSETGFLAGEAALNSLVAVETFKYTLRRERPFQGDGSGPFFQSGGTSFPSEHAAAAWSVAGVIAHEYPGTLTKIAVYSLATLVDISRVHGRQHFPSDVLVGSVLGNLVAQNIYSRHHDPGLGGEAWRSISQFVRGDGNHSPANMGSPYVPLDSWVYPALERLVALGYIKSAFLAMRPWTRFECVRLITEAEERLDDGRSTTSDAVKIYDALKWEFSRDIELLGGGNNETARVESVYTRFTGISGKPLSEGYQYDFGQTLINDYGRPYEEGLNNVTGFSGWATEGTLVAYVSGEYQYAPSAPALPLAVRQFISQSQQVPVPPSLPISEEMRFQMLDSYIGLTLDNWQVTYGRQSLWWGPGNGGSMMLSNNSEPIDMFRINRVSPFKLPSVLGWMGPMRVEFILGQLTGQSFIFGQNTGLLGSWNAPFAPQPMIQGERFSFKPTSNLEFGFSLTTLFAGSGVPFTAHTFLKSILSFGNANPGTAQDPGDRRSGFDLSYRLPKLRNWVTFYADGFTDDEFSPVAYWDRSAWTAGIYLSHFPEVPKLDLRVEGVYTDLPAGGALSHGFFYWNDRYHSGYTNNGDLLGSWIGRQSQGAQAWTTYHFTPRSSLQLNFRHQKASQQFIPGGGTLTDVGAKGDYLVRSNLSLSASVQYERWLFPVIQPNAQRNVTASVQIKFEPQKLFQRSGSNGTGSMSANGVRP